MVALLAELGDPQDAYPVIHVAGTKGKGSTSALSASALKAAGYRTGLYTSPHLQDYTERIQVDGEPISHAELTELVELVKPVVANLPFITTFEITTAIGFLAFARRKVDAAVIEVGLGGRLDATNVVTPEVAVITSLSYDHMLVLGDTLAKIAAEKAGQIVDNMGIQVTNFVTVVRCYLAQMQLLKRNTIESLKLAQEALILAEHPKRSVFSGEGDIIHAHWLLGAAYRQQGQFGESEIHLGEALSRCRAINNVQREADILLDLARLRYDQQKYEEAKSLADEALLVTERCGYVLQGADVNLFLAKLTLTLDPSPEGRGKAREYAETALKLATGWEEVDGKVVYDTTGKYVGWKLALMTIMIGSLVGSVVGVSLLAAQVIKREEYIPWPFSGPGRSERPFLWNPHS